LQTFNKIGKVYYKNIEDLRPVIYTDKEEKIKKRILVHPFASKKTKEWPYIRDLIDILIHKGYGVVVVGKGNSQLFDNITNLINKTSLLELIHEINKAEIIVSTDSGPLHLATALNKTVIALFGPTTKELGFYPPFRRTYVLENKELLCRPCHVHGRKNCPLKHFKCMKEILPENIVKMISTIIA
jgi:ADP-heptose:LPS heptosyltransferase